MEKLLKYLNSLSKDERAAFVAACGTSEGYLRKAISTSQLLGSALCGKIERASGKTVARQDLRPNDWRDHWPELAALNPPPRRVARKPPSVPN